MRAPNKLFEYIQARLAVIVSPCPDMKVLVTRNNIGIAADDSTPESFAKALCALTSERIDSYKKASHILARTCAWQQNEEWLNSIISAP